MAAASWSGTRPVRFWIGGARYAASSWRGVYITLATAVLRKGLKLPAEFLARRMYTSDGTRAKDGRVRGPEQRVATLFDGTALHVNLTSDKFVARSRTLVEMLGTTLTVEYLPGQPTSRVWLDALSEERMWPEDGLPIRLDEYEPGVPEVPQYS